jgi:hypothetical protein
MAKDSLDSYKMFSDGDDDDSALTAPECKSVSVSSYD